MVYLILRKNSSTESVSWQERPFYAPINVKPAGGRRGIGRDFYIFRKIIVKFPTPGKNVRSNITKFPAPRNDLWSRARTKIQLSLPPGQQENSNALPSGQSDRSKSRPMPRRPDIDRCIMRKEGKNTLIKVGISSGFRVSNLFIAVRYSWKFRNATHYYLP